MAVVEGNDACGKQKCESRSERKPSIDSGYHSAPIILYNVLASKYYTNTSDVKLTKLFFGFVYPADSHVVQFASEMRES